ncbi:flavodoxin family protein [Fusibacter ferrireducens]|uniref:NAD(P)H-dependent oxidoreductase n=1 Tax=Fusibacter ferrireducens TaxID=2785058 RepID=A0ABR9ZT52_9FIRM|nr:NAD(P)H-dependent oxidoreductase [Fusibacter ferrireducens]MBF4692779.1 NAD(P)H-dependent oxidoreductase [Fusibacter ferrireducens]
MAGIEIINYSKHMKPIVTFCEGLVSQESEKDKNKCLLVIELDDIGENEAVDQLLRTETRKQLKGETTFFNDKILALIVKSHSEHYTKTFAKKCIYHINQLGGTFIGHPLVEIIEGYQNFKTWQKVDSKPLERICFEQIEQLIKRLHTYQALNRATLNMLVLHAGYREISNTLMLWDAVANALEIYNAKKDVPILNMDTLHVEEGKISDCYGCSFETCMYYAREKSCFYGGFVVEDLYPKLEKADIVVWICPNYNDAISAKLMAVINRLTALYRNMGFKDKYLLSVIVSGNSGSDSVARQLIGALNINKGFRLPAGFSIMALANDPGEINHALNIDEKISSYVNKVVTLIEENIIKN